MKTFGWIWLLLAVEVATAFSQVTTGRLEGTVTDPQGATVQGASVKVVNKETGQAFETAAEVKNERSRLIFLKVGDEEIQKE